MTTPLLETKLHAPRRRRELVSRSRLSDRLRRSSAAALTVVSAPAGFGKTTLLTEWFGDESQTAWLSLDARDNDPARFWTYLVGALRTVVPEIGETALSLLGPSPSAVEAALVTLVNEIDGDQLGRCT